MIKCAMEFVIIVMSQALLHDSDSMSLESDWVFPNDSDAGKVQVTLWEKWLDFIFLHNKLNMIIIMFK